jgi:endonuclease I
MESDLYNLVPAIGEISGLRSNFSFAMILGEKRKFCTCDMKIENRKAEPRPGVRGNIASIVTMTETEGFTGKEIRQWKQRYAAYWILNRFFT